MLFPSSESLSPKRERPTSWVALKNIFCWRVSLKHSMAIFNLEACSEKGWSIAEPTSMANMIASFDIFILFIKQFISNNI